MKLATVLNEARKNPELNPKVSVNQHISDALASAIKSKSYIGGIVNCFVSMTDIAKLGINPKSTYSTPLGIYSYPAEFVVEQAGNKKSLETSLTFAGDAPYVNIFQVHGNVINLGEISDGEVSALYEKIHSVFHAFSKRDNDNELVDEFISTAQHQSSVRALPGGRLWYVLKRTADAMSPRIKNNSPIMWNKLCRAIGIDGAIDMGHGIIHENEKTQAVFFSIGTITNVKRVLNKYSPAAVSKSVAKGVRDTKLSHQVRQDLKGKSDDEILDMMAQYGDKILAKVSHPSLDLQKAAVRQSPSNIKYLNNPDEGLQLEWIKRNPFMFSMIRNPSESAKQLHAQLYSK